MCKKEQVLTILQGRPSPAVYCLTAGNQHSSQGDWNKVDAELLCQIPSKIQFWTEGKHHKSKLENV
jgi:hypothetical protein